MGRLEEALRVVQGEARSQGVQLRTALSDTWLVLLGDSSLRMVYDHLLGRLLLLWDTWATIGTHARYFLLETYLGDAFQHIWRDIIM